MKKVITALLNKTVNERLKEYKQINVVMNDIQYKEGIIEALEINPEIEYIILSELLPGEILINDLIEKIKQIRNEIKIIIILEKENNELENYLLAKGNIHIFYNNEIKIKEIAELIININKNEELELEIQKLKELIINKKDNFENKYEIKNNANNKIINTENEILITEEEKRKIEEEIENELNNSKIKNKILNNKIIKKVISKIKKQTINNNCKIIIISGISGVGKSFFTVNISKHLAEQKKNILIIDFDFLNNSIQTLFGIKSKIKEKYIEKNNIENLIIKINSKIDLISNINLIFNENSNKDFQILKTIKELKINYDFIIIDINNNEKILNLIKEEIHKIIFITEPNILQIKKSKNILDKYINEIYLEKETIYLLFNKVKNDSISFNILKRVFKNYNTIGKINFINNYNTLINQNMKSIFLEDKIKNQYKNIAKKISQNNKIDKYYLDKIINN